MEEEYQVQNIQAVPKTKALKLLTEEIRCLSFSPERPSIKWQPSGWHHSTLAEQLQETDLSISRCQKTGKIVAYSFETSGEIDKGLYTWVDMYCNPDHSYPNLALLFLVWHIREIAVMKNRKNIICAFQFPNHFIREEVKSCLKDVLNLSLIKHDLHTLLFSSSLKAIYKPKQKL